MTRVQLPLIAAALTLTLLEAAPQQLPDGPGRDVTQKVCGATCHGPDLITGAGRSRDEWTAVVNAMVARGAKAGDSELIQIVDYLTKNVGPRSTDSVASLPRPTKGPGPLGGGAADSHVIDAKGAERGRTIYIAECITCHGNKARGGNASLPPGQQGPDLVRSLVVLHDRYGSTLGPYLVKGHPLQSGRTGSALKHAQVADLAHFLHKTVFETLRGAPALEVQNVLTGDAKAGAAYFNGPGKCSSCHSITGDLAGIGSRYAPPVLQSKFLFPRTVAFGRAGARSTPQKPVTVTVTQASGERVEGTLDKIDDFNVSLRDASGEYLSFKRTPGLKVQVHDPYAEHVALLDQYTDKNIHDTVAYLESLK